MEDVKQAVLTRYEGQAGRDYHAKVHGAAAPVADTVARQRVRKFQPLVRPGDTVFEYGVGTGLNLRHLKCRRRIGYDLSDAGRQSCEAAGIEFLTSLAHVPGDIDLVICHHVLEHVPDPLACLKTLFDLLPPGGGLVLCVPFETHRSYRRYVPGDQNQHLFSWNALTLGNLVAAAGFSDIDVRVAPFGYEQRLAFLAPRAGTAAYRAALWMARHLRPANELFLVANRS